MYEPITETQWLVLESLFPKPIKRGRGKPHAPWRSVLNSILYVLHTGTKWDSLPKREDNPQFAPKSVAHRWFCRWEKEGFLNQILKTIGAPERLSTRASSMPRRKRLSKAQRQEVAFSA